MRDYAMERGPTGAQQCSGQIHLVEGLQEQDVQWAAPIDKDSVELDILDDGANYERIPPQLWDKVRVVTAIKMMGTSDHLRYFGVVGENVMTSQAVSFCFLLDSYESGPP
jgi:hypothetical protein